MRHTLRLILVSLVTASLGAHTSAAEPATKSASPKTVRIVTIGNSFSGNATTYLDDLAEADGHTLVMKSASVGGSSMQLHWDKAQLHEKNPKDKAGLYSAGGLKEILADGPHDFVTIQMSSIKSHDLKNYRPYAAQLQEYVKRHAPEAELLLHETWAYRVDDPRFAPLDPKQGEPKAGEPKTQREMYDMLAHAYRTIAAELKVRLIPVGDAFIAADEDTKWGYRVDPKFDAKQAKPPKLPNQTHSLHVGRRWKPSVKGGQFLSMDGHHANTAGCYLGACVWYEVLFDTTCVGNAFVPNGLDADYARFLQETAHAAVAKEKAR